MAAGVAMTGEDRMLWFSKVSDPAVFESESFLLSAKDGSANAAEALITEFNQIKAERDRMREALEWYGTRSNHEFDHQLCMSKVENDGGEKARAAMKGNP